jgi:hypothetical protein
MVNDILELNRIYNGEYSLEESTWFNGKSYQPLNIHFLSFTNNKIKFKLKLEERTSFHRNSNGLSPQYQDINLVELHFQKENNNYNQLIGTITKKVNFFFLKKTKLKFKFNKVIKNEEEIRDFLIQTIYNNENDLEINISLIDSNNIDIAVYLSYNYKKKPDLLTIYNTITELIILLKI